MKNNHSIALLLIFAISITGFTNLHSDLSKNGFWSMKGTLVTHYYEANSDLHSDTEIFELQDEQGITIWFAKHIFKDVCMTGECKMIRLWLFWDGVGNYLGLQLFDNEPLTKSDHSEFEEADYKKLDIILRDTSSILRGLNSEDLIINHDTIDLYKAYEVDGYTAATQPALSDVVVKDAVYTCHTLWHTVYGPIQKTIQKILDSRVNENYLKLNFYSEKNEYIIWAIHQVEKFPNYHDYFYSHIIRLIKSENPKIAKTALSYLKNAHLKNEELQKMLVDIIPHVSTQLKYDILWKYIEVGEVNEFIALKLLHFLKEEKLGMGALNLILRVISHDHLNNIEIRNILLEFSEHENAYVKNLTQKFIKDQY